MTDSVNEKKGLVAMLFSKVVRPLFNKPPAGRERVECALNNSQQFVNDIDLMLARSSAKAERRKSS